MLTHYAGSTHTLTWKNLKLDTTSDKLNYAPVKSKISTSPFVQCRPVRRNSTFRRHGLTSVCFFIFAYSVGVRLKFQKYGDGGRRLISKRVHSSPFRNFTLTASTVPKFAPGSLSNGCRSLSRLIMLTHYAGSTHTLTWKNLKLEMAADA